MLKIDKDKNLKFYDSFAPCECADCVNFCKQIKSVCGELATFFIQHNIDIEKPFELVSFGSGKSTKYISCQYLVFGECPDDFKMKIGKVTLRKETEGHPSTDEYDKPNFVMDFSITLPNVYN